MAELKSVYRAMCEAPVLEKLDKLKEKWNKKYPMVIRVNGFLIGH